MKAAPIRIPLRLIVGLIVVIAAVANVAAYFQVGGEKRKTARGKVKMSNVQ